MFVFPIYYADICNHFFDLYIDECGSNSCQNSVALVLAVRSMAPPIKLVRQLCADYYVINIVVMPLSDEIQSCEYIV